MIFNLFKRSAPAAAVSAAAPLADNRPERGLRQAARAATRAATRMFASAQSDRLTKSWGSTPLTADDIVSRNQVALVARSREMVANNDHARAFMRMCRQNIVGPSGVMLQAQSRSARGKLDKEANEAIEYAWCEWGHRKNCTVTGKKSWRAVQAGCVQSAAKDGEFFVRKIYGADAGPWGFALQTIDAQRCPVTLDVQRLNGGSNFVRAGIEFNRFGRPVAYYFTTTDESEQQFVYGGTAHVRIPADQIIHGFVDEMEGQKRGLPWMATGLLRLRNLQGYEEAAVIGQRISASKMGWIAFDKDTDGPDYDEENPPEIDADPGTFGILPRGAHIETFAPAASSGEFLPFTKHTLRGIAAGWGVPYNELAADLEGVNFSSIRQGTLDSREYWKELQEWLTEELVQPVFEAWLAYSLVAGRIAYKNKPLQASKIDQYSEVSWQPRRWQWIDPRADVDAAVESKNNFLKSPGEIIREQGSDPQTVWIETARDMRAQVDALEAEGFSKEEAMDLVKMGFGIQPKPPAPAAKPQPKATE
ncbi:phage portal protein [Bradyrhizobium sp. BWC-3-1]|uniref:phage portal protein n=1 Tax=Bradyrhizobium sp. BWC-3-1 TaxID=3080012 RepID=UPI00293E927A|nr:phage portal protein [Bradyrhizobium sp. BWC-3-1]WOH61913.1 phage portal protein [Bradyrhizobium sp. BWC-3-1]